MTLAAIKAALTEQQALALTAWAEARGDRREGNSSVEERIAVMCIIRNRVRNPSWWGNSFRTVCLKAWQFSCWNEGTDQNHLELKALAYLVATGQPTGNSIYEETAYLAAGIISGVIVDRVGGADHYYAPKAMLPKGAVPKWAKGAGGKTIPPLVIVGDQHFYRLRSV